MRNLISEIIEGKKIRGDVIAHHHNRIYLGHDRTYGDMFLSISDYDPNNSANMNVMLNIGTFRISIDNISHIEHLFVYARLMAIIEEHTKQLDINNDDLKDVPSTLNGYVLAAVSRLNYTCYPSIKLDSARQLLLAKVRNYIRKTGGVVPSKIIAITPVIDEILRDHPEPKFDINDIDDIYKVIKILDS